MTLEQKAKAYDEALEIAKKNYETSQNLCDGSIIGVECFKNTLTSIFPELKESSDEKIRKDILEFIKREGQHIDKYKWHKWIAWLEKQGKEKNITHEEICKSYGIPDIGEFSDGYHTFNGLYKQRMILFAVLVKTYKDRAWKSWKHEDGLDCFGGGWFIVGIDTPAGTYTYHYEAKDWDRFDCQILEKAKHWDGHDESDVERLFSLVSNANKDEVVRCLINGMNFYYNDNEEATWGTEKFSMKVKDILFWLEIQRQSKKTSIWKHWKDGIAGNGDGIPVFLIKNGSTYSLSSCLSYECDYIELSELDNLMLEKQGEQNYEFHGIVKSRPAKGTLKKLVDEIGPKFKAGDNISNGRCVRHIPCVTNRHYLFGDGTGGYCDDIDKEYHLITNADADDDKGWSKEDEDMLKKAIKLLDEFGGDRNACAYTLQEMSCRDCADWLKSLKQRMQWADKNPDGKMLLHVCNKSAEQAKKLMIDKACEWLQKNADTYIGVEGLAILQDAFFEDFRKAMKRE